jgi:hypothetical protein
MKLLYKSLEHIFYGSNHRVLKMAAELMAA